MRRSGWRAIGVVSTWIVLTVCALSFTTGPAVASVTGSPSKTGTSFIPQIVQLPGWSDLIHGCMGLW